MAQQKPALSRQKSEKKKRVSQEGKLLDNTALLQPNTPEKTIVPLHQQQQNEEPRPHLLGSNEMF